MIATTSHSDQRNDSIVTVTARKAAVRHEYLLPVASGPSMQLPAGTLPCWFA
jgi:hypothetical protein